MFNGGDTNLFGYVLNDPVNLIDPTGLKCQYSQSSGQMTCTNGSGTYYNQGGYSGTGSGRNNPNAQNQVNVGPIPQGTYTTGAPYSGGRTGPNTISLMPDAPTASFISGMGRDPNTFRIHGGGSDASTGCIILPPNRTNIPPGETINVGP